MIWTVIGSELGKSRVVLKPKSSLRLESIRIKGVISVKPTLFEVFPVLEEGFLIYKGGTQDELFREIPG